MTTIVVDASAWVEYILGSDLGDDVAATIEDPDADLRSPALCDVEVMSTLRSLVLSRKVELRRATEAVDDYCDLPLTRHDHLQLLDRLLELRDNFTAYDAVYVALTEMLGAELLTCDAPLARAIGEHLPKLRVRAFIAAV